MVCVTRRRSELGVATQMTQFFASRMANWCASHCAFCLAHWRPLVDDGLQSDRSDLWFTAFERLMGVS